MPEAEGEGAPGARGRRGETGPAETGAKGPHDIA